MMKLWGDEVMAFLKEFLCVWNCVCVCAHSEVFVKRGLHDCTLAYMLEIVFVSFKKRGRMKAMIFFHYIIISNRRLYKNGKVKNKRSIFIGLCVWLGETKKTFFLLSATNFVIFKTCNYTTALQVRFCNYWTTRS